MKIFTLFFLLFLGMRLAASPVRISFLNDEDALKQTTVFLFKKGCDRGTVDRFDSVVHSNYQTPLGLDLSQFPRAERGFYVFSSISNLIQALPKPVIEADHPAQLNCFDNVILLAGGRIQTRLEPDTMAGPFLVPAMVSKFTVNMVVEGTPRDAFNAACPAEVVEASKAVFNGTLQDKRICLNTVFDSFCILPHSISSENAKPALLHALQAGWKRNGVIFPANVEVVICHNAVFPGDKTPSFNAPFAMATHSGLLFKDHNQFVYLEKDGASGPFVRLDFTDKKDLLPWLESVIKPTTNERDHSFVTFNDQEIEPLN